MVDLETLERMIPEAFRGLDLDWPYERRPGKVRESLSLPDRRRLLVTTDRLSAFDVVLAALPYKGQILNQLSAFWFERTTDVVPNHLLDVPDPNTSLVVECEPLPVEVIVRGYITGSTKTSLWTLYAAGEREIYGYTFPDGLKKNAPLPQPIITPTTKAGPGEHDERLTCAEVVERGLLDARTWDIVQDAALAIFKRGQAIAEAAGFRLVDTKYEFGRASDGTLMLIDEVHTPDSSRFWRTDPVPGAQPDQWDKEFVRLWYAEQGYRGDGPPPELPPAVIAEAAQRYIALYEGLTGQDFEPGAYPVGPRVTAVAWSFLD
ncbi:MAG: phosphoribosylaminoimidazolesuccinocarboxamide synthase [Anaerolineae bacterium]